MTSGITDTDILIVGGGMVGASLACALRHTGYRIALIEARDPAINGGCGYDDRTAALAHSSMRILQGMGLWQTIQPEATPIRTIHISETGRFGSTRLQHADAGVAALGHVATNHSIIRALYDSLNACDTVELWAPAQLHGLRVEAHAVSAHLAYQDRAPTVTARLLVAADGADSAVRRQLGIGAETHHYGQSAIVANVTSERPHANEAYERFTRRGPLALLPMSEGRCALIWTHTPEAAAAMAESGDTDFLAALQAEFGYRLGRFTHVGARSVYPLSLTRSARLTDARLALIGNAAHTLHPVAGQGFNLALRDVAELGELLWQARADGSDDTDPGQPALLAEYQKRRKHDIARTITFTDGLARFFTNPFIPVWHTRGIARGVIDRSPWIRRRFARHASGIRVHASRLACGLPLTVEGHD